MKNPFVLDVAYRHLPFWKRRGCGTYTFFLSTAATGSPKEASVEKRIYSMNFKKGGVMGSLPRPSLEAPCFND